MHTHLAFAFLTLLALLPWVVAAVALFRSPLTVPQTVLWWTAYLLARCLWRAPRPPRLPVESGQGAVIVCNHRSSVDPVFLQVCVQRPIHWLVAREYYEHVAFRWLLKTIEVIPVNRAGIDTAATKAAIRTLRNGGLVGMFPEGRINTTCEFMLPVRPGVLLVADKARVPVIPCCIQGSPYDETPWSPLLMPAKVRMRIGAPILPDRLGVGDPTEGSASAMLELVRCMAQLAGDQEFEPQLAGRRWKP